MVVIVMRESLMMIIQLSLQLIVIIIIKNDYNHQQDKDGKDDTRDADVQKKYSAVTQRQITAISILGFCIMLCMQEVGDKLKEKSTWNVGPWKTARKVSVRCRIKSAILPGSHLKVDDGVGDGVAQKSSIGTYSIWERSWTL